MRKKLKFLIAAAICLNVTTTAFAAETASSSNVPVSLTLEQAISKLSTDNQQLKNVDTQIDAANTQYNWDKMNSLAITTSGKAQSQYKASDYAGIVTQRDLTPLSDEKAIADLKNNKDETLNTIKFDLEKNYMKVMIYKQQIDNINKNVADLDEQINQMQQKIDLGQATADKLNPLKVQKNALLSQITTPQTQMQNALLTIKKYLNIDSNSELNLATSKKDFVKFDDTDIDNKILKAVENAYSYQSLQKDIDLQKKTVDIQTKYAYDSVTEPMNSQLKLQDEQNSLTNTNTLLQVSLWNSYYNLKNAEDAVETQNSALEAEQLSYDSVKQQFDNGLKTKVDLDSEELALNQQKAATQDAVNDYMVTVEQFNYILNGHATVASASTQRQ